MISAKEALELGKVESRIVDSYLEINVCPAIEQAAKRGKRSVMVPLESIGINDPIVNQKFPMLTGLQKAAVDKLCSLGYTWALTSETSYSGKISCIEIMW